jgi:putative ABC transport system permease protein
MAWHAACPCNTMPSLLQDARLSVRQLRKIPGFAVTTVLTLALGIGAATAIFSLVDAVMLRPLPYPQQDRLMWLAQVDTSINATAPEPFSYPDVADWRAQSHSFTAIANFHNNSLTLTGAGSPQQLIAETVSSNYFQVLGMRPMLGRDFVPEDDNRGVRTVMLSHELWRSTFSSDPSVSGRSIVLDGGSYRVAGVMPANFVALEGRAPMLWVTMAEDTEGEEAPAKQRGFDYLRVVGRLKPGVSPEQAHAELNIIARHLAEQYPDSNKSYTSTLVNPVLEHLTGNVQRPLSVLFGAVVLVLLIACANVAGLMLARSSRRRGEIAVRAALGAGRAGIIRQVLVEASLLSVAGGILGVAFSTWILDALVALAPTTLPRAADIAVNAPVLAFAIAVSLAAGLLFGVVPAWRMSRLDASLALRESGRGMTAGRGQQRLQNWLVIAETSVGLVLLVGSGLLIRSFLQVLRVDPGFDAKHLLTAQINLPQGRYDRERKLAFYDRLTAEISSLPDVRVASAAFPLPLSDNNIGISFHIEGRPTAPGDADSVATNIAAPKYFETMRIPLLAGRTFTERDGTHAPPVIVINQRFARRYFSGQDPLGKHMKADIGDGTIRSPMREIVGVVGDVKRRELTDETEPQFYIPFAQAVITSPALCIRTAGDPRQLVGPLRALLTRLDPEVPLYRVATMEEAMSKAAAQPWFQTLLLSCFAAMALLLSAVGLYSVLSYMVAQRAHEIGLRMALGAQRTGVLTWILRRGLGLTAAGIFLGLVVSSVVTRSLAASGMLYRVQAFDVPTLAGMTLVLVAISAAASAFPAWRAARLDPMRILRDQ